MLGDPRDQREIVCTENGRAGAGGRSFQHLRRECVIGAVGVALLLERHRLGLVVRSFHESDDRLERHQPRKIFRRAAQIRLKCDAGGRVISFQRDVELERSVHVARVFHVQPERRSVFIRLGREREQMILAVVEREIEAELRWLDADLCRKAHRVNLIEQKQIMIAHQNRGLGTGDRFAELS